MPVRNEHNDAISGCLLGCAVGDAIGLPYEGLSARRSRRFARLPLEHRFLFGRGMVSDDTDHTVFVLQSLIVSRGDAARFRRALAWRMRLWLLCLPAGIGWATLRSIALMWLGLPRTGIRSAGNGPSMRSAIIGAMLHADAAARAVHVEISTRLTHTDPRALAGAAAVAEVAARVASGEWRQRPAVEHLLAVLAAVSEEGEWRLAVERIGAACSAPTPMDQAMRNFGGRDGVSGYALHSVPFALVAWHHHFGDFRATIEAVTQAGGDVDTVAAIAGALAGAVSGARGIPPAWVDGICDWPHSVEYVRRLALGATVGQGDLRTHFSPWLFPRGLLFTTIVLLHGFRRLFPPY